MKKRYIPIIISILLTIGLVSCGSPKGSGSNFSEENTSINISSESSSSNKINDKTNIKVINEDYLKNEEEALVKWEGRYEYKEKTSSLPSMMLLYFTATGFTVDFYGTELKAEFYHAKDFNGTLDGNIYYDVKVNDEVLPNLAKRRFCLPSNETRTTVDLVSGLSEKRHTATILKMNEGADGYTGIISISTDGYFYKRDVEKDNSNLKFMAVCASSGSGYGNLAYNEVSENYHSRTRENSSSLHSYMYLTARRFGADISYVGQAGWGVEFPVKKSINGVIDKCGITPSNSVDGAKTTGDWDHSKYIPDVILLHIGGNDTKNSAFDLETYQEGVVSLVTKLHTCYPNAKMVWTHTNSKAGTYAINALKSQGIISEGYLKQCIIPGIGEGETGAGSYGASNHQSLKTHIDSSNKICETVSRLGYEIIRDQIEFSDFEYLLEK